jgi:hypothetical protein
MIRSLLWEEIAYSENEDFFECKEIFFSSAENFSFGILESLCLPISH